VELPKYSQALHDLVLFDFSGGLKRRSLRKAEKNFHVFLSTVMLRVGGAYENETPGTRESAGAKPCSMLNAMILKLSVLCDVFQACDSSAKAAWDFANNQDGAYKGTTKLHRVFKGFLGFDGQWNCFFRYHWENVLMNRFLLVLSSSHNETLSYD